MKATYLPPVLRAIPVKWFPVALSANTQSVELLHVEALDYVQKPPWGTTPMESHPRLFVQSGVLRGIVPNSTHPH